MKERTDRLMKEYFLMEVKNVPVPPVPGEPGVPAVKGISSSLRRALFSAAASIAVTVLSGVVLVQFDRVTSLERTLTEIEHEYRLSEKTIAGIQKLQQLYSFRHGGGK